ncbi:MAG TPA: host attachment protein [Lacunisphaera sp.]|jgi:hypothetical protein|nr:host attachment protein [Lacunisphaera sp.]
MSPPSQDAVSRRAHELWERAGRPHGRAVEFWLAAENELRAAAGDTPEREHEHFIVVIDHAHLRVYDARDRRGPGGARFELAEAFELPGGRDHATARETDQAGRFASANVAGAAIDEGLPMPHEQERRLAASLAGLIDRFLVEHAEATWDFAAGPELHHAVLKQMSPGVRGRVAAIVPKVITHQTPAELRAFFPGGAP